MSDLNIASMSNELTTPYPRLCAHRGFSTAAPENSMPAFLAALNLGAQEIEFDLQPTADGEVISLHDRTLDRVCEGTGPVSVHTLKQLQQLDFGFRHGEAFRGLRILTFEEILASLGKKIIMNAEVKTPDLEHPLPESYIRRIVGLVRQYGCEQYLYLTCGNDCATRQLIELAPDIKL